MNHQLADVIKSGAVTIAALLPIVNPIGSAPIFLSMSADLPAAGRRQLARLVARNAYVLLAGAMLIGSQVLRIFGISLPIVRVAGGLLVAANGWHLINADETQSSPNPPVSDAWERAIATRAFFPLTFPLTVGPGSVSIAITLGARESFTGTSSAINLGTDLIAVGIVALVVYLSYRFASRLITYLGETGTVVFLRLSAFILMCVGVSIIWSGIVDLIQPLLPR
ncbi:MAG TPA: MarC family protein [Vicinamibacterales bacterium]|nr:MarC family protein [Vicinamibacterales bacterium]